MWILRGPGRRALSKPAYEMGLVSESQGDAAGVAAGGVHFDLALAAAHDAGKFLAPFDENDAVGGGKLFETQRVELALVLDAVEVKVVEDDRLFASVDGACAVILMHEGEGGAG